MAKQVSSSVWTDDTEIHLFINMFLELLVKYEYVWCEEDEKTFRISLPERKRMLFAEDFLEFQKGLTSFDMAIQTRKIRKLYKEELMELQKSGKSINDSKLLWFSKAHRLFSEKTGEKEEVLSQESNSNSTDNPAVNKSNVNIRNFNCKSKKTASLTPTQVPSFSKQAIVASTTNMTTVSTITAPSLHHAINPFLTVNPESDADKQCMKTTTEFSSPKQVVTTTNCSTAKTCLRAISKVSSVRSPFKMVATPSQVRHPFHPPTCMSPISRIPLRRRTIHSTVSVPLTPTTTTSATRSPHLSNIKSSNDRGTSHTIYRSLSFQNRPPRNVPSQDTAPISPAVIPQNSCVPRPTTRAPPLYKEPIYMNIQYPRMTPPLNKPHEPSTSNIPKAPFRLATSCFRYKEPSSVASSSRIKAFALHNKHPPPYNFDVPSVLDTKSSRIVVPLSHAVPSCSNISTSAILSSADDVNSTVSTTREPSLSISSSSRIGAPFLNNKPPPYYKPNVYALVVTTSSKITPSISNVAASCSSDVSMSSTSSRADDSVTVPTPKYRAPSTSISSSTRNGNFLVYNKPPPPYNPEVPPTSITTSSRTLVPVSYISVQSNSGVSMLPLSSSSDNVPTSAPTSCSHNSIASDDSRDGFFRLPYRHPPPYEPKAPTSLVVPFSRTTVPPLQIVQSSSHGVYTEAGTSSSTSGFMRSFSDQILAKSPPSIDIMSEVVSFNDVPTITPYRSPLPSTPKVPTSTFTFPSEVQVSSFLTSPSTSLQILIPNVSFSSSGLPLSPTSPYSRTGVISTASTFSTGVPLSPADSGVPPSPMPAPSPTETPSPSPLITDIEFIF